MKKKTTTKNHYINNKKMYEAIKQYKEECRLAEEKGLPKPQIPNYLGDCIFMIAKKLSNSPNFFNYSYKDEMISDGYMNCIAYFDNFDPERFTNPFGYFTKIVYNAFRNRIKLEKKQQYFKYKGAQLFYESEQIWEDASHSIRRDANEIADKFIQEYEQKLTDKKKKSKVGVEKFAD